MKKNKHSFLWVALVVVIVGVLAWFGSGDVSAAIPSGVLYQLDIPYGAEPVQKLDVFYKDTFNNAPVVIGIHGGGWIRGDRTSMQKFVRFLVKEKGYVYVTPDYTLAVSGSPSTQYPKGPHDVATAVKWVQDNIATYKGDGTRIVLLGSSAGAHIGALLAYGDDPAWLGTSRLPYVDISSSIRGFVGAAGPYDFDLIPNNTLNKNVAPFLGQYYDPASWSIAEPGTYAFADDPAALLFSGTEDKVVNKPDENGRYDGSTNQSVNFNSLLTGKRLSSDIMFISGPHNVFMQVFKSDVAVRERLGSFLSTVFGT